MSGRNLIGRAHDLFSQLQPEQRYTLWHFIGGWFDLMPVNSAEMPKTSTEFPRIRQRVVLVVLVVLRTRKLEVLLLKY